MICCIVAPMIYARTVSLLHAAHLGRSVFVHQTWRAQLGENELGFFFLVFNIRSAASIFGLDQ